MSDRYLDAMRAITDELKTQNEIAQRQMQQAIAGAGGGKAYCYMHGGEWPCPTCATDTPDATTKTVETTRQPDPAWKKAVLEQAGGTCEYVDNGKRCVVAKDLHAISFKPGSKRPEDGTALCPHHVDVVENGTENG